MPVSSRNNCSGTSCGALTSTLAPGELAVALPDLRSRLRALPVVTIAAPDETLLKAVLVKHFADRQLRVMPAAIGYLVPRMERSFAMAAALTAHLDELALATGRPIGIPLARRALAELGG